MLHNIVYKFTKDDNIARGRVAIKNISPGSQTERNTFLTSKILSLPAVQMCFVKIIFHRKTPVVESYFSKVIDVSPANLLYQDFNSGIFLYIYIRTSASSCFCTRHFTHFVPYLLFKSLSLCYQRHLGTVVLLMEVYLPLVNIFYQQ